MIIDSYPIINFLILAAIFTIMWGRLLWYFYEKSKLLTNIIFYLMAFSGLSFAEMKSLLLSIIYFFFGIAGAVLFAYTYDLRITRFLLLSIFTIPTVLLGIVAEISLTRFMVMISLQLVPQESINPFLEVQNIPWINGIRDLPKMIKPVVPAFAGLVEEFFFRGVVLFILTNKFFISPSLAVVVAGILFLIQQLLHLQTRIQMVIISCSCLAISLVGGILVLYTDSIIPAGISHASFVIFFFGYSGLLKGTDRERNDCYIGSSPRQE